MVTNNCDRYTSETDISPFLRHNCTTSLPNREASQQRYQYLIFRKFTQASTLEQESFVVDHEQGIGYVQYTSQRSSSFQGAWCILYPSILAGCCLSEAQPFPSTNPTNSDSTIHNRYANHQPPVTQPSTASVPAIKPPVSYPLIHRKTIGKPREIHHFYWETMENHQKTVEKNTIFIGKPWEMGNHWKSWEIHRFYLETTGNPREIHGNPPVSPAFQARLHLPTRRRGTVRRHGHRGPKARQRPVLLVAGDHDKSLAGPRWNWWSDGV